MTAIRSDVTAPSQREFGFLERNPGLLPPLGLLVPLVLLNSDAMYLWPLGIMVFVGEYATEWSLVLAFITLTILPAIIMFLLAQRHIVAGLTAGAVKG